MALMDDKLSKHISPIHSVVMENRERISISGVEDVESFDEMNMLINTQMGLLEIKGAGLHINKFSVDIGELMIEGEIDEVVYLQEEKYTAKKGSFFSKLLG